MADEETGEGPREWGTLLKLIIFSAFAAVVIGIVYFIFRVMGLTK